VTYATVVDGSRSFRLTDVDPAAHGGLTREQAEEQLESLSRELRELQGLMFAGEGNALLVILQGMDAAGKDVTIQNVFVLANPEGIRVKHFRPMTDEEEKHHFLWRGHVESPARGEVVIFDRSYYDQLIAPQVDEELDGEELGTRVEDVLAFERMLRHGGTIVTKFFLHVSADEQERRLHERMDREPWLVSARDWTARRSWDGYMAAYERVINDTATAESPWHAVSADQQWFHNLSVAEALVERMRSHREAWIEARDQRGAKKRAEAEQEAPPKSTSARS
jgi:PPK2 family polyphosphate:nucleotide phosphotransferase